MPHYMIRGTYTSDGVKGLLSEGGSSRFSQATSLIESLGGTIECMYFAFGGDDLYCIAEMPDDASAAAVSLTVGSTGMAEVSITPLITAEGLDEASKKAGGTEFRPAGA